MSKDTPWEKYRADRYKPTNNFRLPPEVLAKIHRKHYGLVGGLMVWGIDGEAVRDLVDIDFTTGGNPARYLYVPPNELWIERWLSLTDFAAVIFHEYIEYRLMKDRRMTYERAHDRATIAELPMRKDMRRGLIRVRTREDAVRAALKWYESTE